MRVHYLAIFAALGTVLAASNVYADEDSMRRVTVLDVPSPSVEQVDEALFPTDISKLKVECAQMEKAGLRCQSSVPKSSMDTVQVTFAKSSVELSADAKEFLKTVGQSLQKHSNEMKSLTIEGYADASGTEIYNKNLSKKRAESVKKFLSTNYHVANIETVGMGSEHLRDASNPGAEVNRRIEFVPNW